MGPKIASSDLCPYPIKLGGLHHSLDKFPPDTFPSILGVDSDGDNMSILSEDDISQDLLIFSTSVCIDINQKGFWIEGMKVKEGRPIVWRFGKGLAFDLEDGI
jgi:hypothetical protein